MKKFFLFDVETGGQSLHTSLMTLYGIVLDDKLQVQDTIDLMLKPNNGIYNITAKALSINGIDLVTHDKHAIPEAKGASLFYNFLCKHSFDNVKMIPVGHNISFDIHFVKNRLLQANNAEGNSWSKFFSYRQLDTATIANYLILAGKLPDQLDCSLESLANHFEFDYSKAHNAQFDANLTLRVLKKLIELVGDAPVY